MDSVDQLPEAFEEFIAAIEASGRRFSLTNPLTQLGDIAPSLDPPLVSDIRAGAKGGRQPIDLAQEIVAQLAAGFDADWLREESVTGASQKLKLLLECYIDGYPKRAAEWRKIARVGPGAKPRLAPRENKQSTIPLSGARCPQLAAVQAEFDRGPNSGSAEEPALQVRLFFGDADGDGGEQIYRTQLASCAIECELGGARRVGDPNPVEFTISGTTVRFDGYGFDDEPGWRRAVPPKDAVLKGVSDWQPICQVRGVIDDIIVRLKASAHDFRLKGASLEARPSTADRLKQNFFRRWTLGEPDAAGQYTLDARRVRSAAKDGR